MVRYPSLTGLLFSPITYFIGCPQTSFTLPRAKRAWSGSMAWKTVDIYEQRVRFVVAAAQGAQTFGALCTEFGISRPTGYLWLRRYKELGVRGIAEQSRRPC